MGREADEAQAAELQALLTGVSPTELGQRVRTARRAAEMTQAELASGEASVGFISRVESGARRPNLQLLTVIAQRLGVEASFLLTGFQARRQRTFGSVAAHAELDHVELTLRCGDVDEAERLLRQVARGPDLWAGPIADRVESLWALMAEARGRAEDAEVALSELCARASDDTVAAAEIAVALCRVRLALGSATEVVATGRAHLAVLCSLGLSGCHIALWLQCLSFDALRSAGESREAEATARAAVNAIKNLGSLEDLAHAFAAAGEAAAVRGAARDAASLRTAALQLLNETERQRARTRLGLLFAEIDEADLRLRPEP